MATTPRRTVKTPGATETTTPDPAPTAETENTTGTVSEPVVEQGADETTSDATTDPAPTAEATQALPDDYEEFLAWKNSQSKSAEPKTTVAATTSTGAVDSTPKRKRPVLGPQGWTQEEY